MLVTSQRQLLGANLEHLLGVGQGHLLGVIQAHQQGVSLGGGDRPGWWGGKQCLSLIVGAVWKEENVMTRNLGLTQ